MATIDVHADVDNYHIEQYGKHQHLSHLEEADKELEEHWTIGKIDEEGIPGPPHPVTQAG